MTHQIKLVIIVYKGRCQKKNGKMWEFFPSRGPPPSPLFGNFFLILPFIFGRSPMLKTVKKWKWDSVSQTPPLFFFSKFPHFPVFWGGNVPKQQNIDMNIPSTETCLFHGSWGQWVSPGVSLNRVIGYTGGRSPPHSCHAQQSQGYNNVCSEVNEDSAYL